MPSLSNLPSDRNSRTLPSRERSSTFSASSPSRGHIDDDVEMDGRDRYLTPSSSSQPSVRPEANHVRPALDVVGSKVRDLVNTINKLQRLGIEKIGNLPLPKIVVVGDQSAGKSSLVEAISEIKVPRSSGTCTRCPLQITLRPTSAQWSSSISILKRFAKGEEPGHFQEGRLGPWEPLNMAESIPFIDNCSKADLEIFLARAQNAVLNPAMDPRDFVNGLLTDNPQCGFSPNVVCLDISSPEVTSELSFTDLPGVINQYGDATGKYLPKLVKHLVRSYVQDNQALVLLACSVETDIANSAAAKIVRDAEAEYRTIGVLTKPDRLPAGTNFGDLRDILEGRRFELGHGYYVTKQLSQVELENQVSHAEARISEARFFKTTAPWHQTFESFGARFGTPNLQTELSRLLAKQIMSELPNITAKINNKQLQVSEQLANLPKVPAENSLRITLEFLALFKSEIQQAIKGEYPNHLFKTEWRAYAEGYRSQMTTMRPALFIKSSEEAKRKSELPRPISIDDSEHDEQQQRTPSASRKRPVKSEPVTPKKKAKHRNTNGSNTSEGIRVRGTLFTLDAIRELLQNMRSDIPNLPQPKAIEILISRSITGWNEPLKYLFDSVTSLLTDKVSTTLNLHLALWEKTELFQVVKSASAEFMLAASARLHRKLAKILNYELAHPLTLNEGALDYHQQHELRVFEAARREFRGGLMIDEQEAITGKFTEDSDRVRKLEKLTPEMLKPDPWQREVEVMSRVRGYYSVAAIRLVDHVYQIVQAELFEHCSTNLPVALEEALGIHKTDAFENCVRLLSEDPGRERKRCELNAELEKLTQAKQRLEDLCVKHEL